MNNKKIAVGAKELLLNFYEDAQTEGGILKESIENPNCEVYTTVLNIAELNHLIQVKEYEKYLEKNELSNTEFSFEQYKNEENEREKFKNKFAEIYNKINSCIHIEKFFLDESFEKEYSKERAKVNIFGFALKKFSENNNIVNVI